MNPIETAVHAQERAARIWQAAAHLRAAFERDGFGASELVLEQRRAEAAYTHARLLYTWALKFL